LKTRTGSFLAAIIMIAIIVFLAADAGFTLYNPNRFSFSNPSCKLDIICGDIQVLKKDSLTWEPAVDGSILEPGSRVKTAAGAHGVIVFSNGTTTKLDPSTDVIIDKLDDGENSQQYTVFLKQQSGKTWNQVKKSLDKTVFQIRTVSAEVNVHGTLFSTEVDKSGKTIVKTTEGCVSVAAEGQEVEVNPGKMTQVLPGLQPSLPVDIPQPKYELVVTFDKDTVGMVSDPTGSSTGFADTETAVNQITESSITVDEETGRTIHIPGAKVGDYKLTVQGTADGVGEVSVEGFIDGESAFLNIQSCNITAAKETLVQLHYDVLTGLLHQNNGDQGTLKGKAVMASDISDKSASGVSTVKTQTSATAAGKAQTAGLADGETADDSFKWFHGDKPGQMTRWITVGCLLFAITIVFLVMRRNT
jgi:FecR protein